MGPGTSSVGEFVRDLREANEQSWRTHPRARHLRLAGMLAWGGLASIWVFLFGYPVLRTVSIVGMVIATLAIVPAGVGLLIYARFPDLRQSFARKELRKVSERRRLAIAFWGALLVVGASIWVLVTASYRNPLAAGPFEWLWTALAFVVGGTLLYGAGRNDLGIFRT